MISIGVVILITLTIVAAFEEKAVEPKQSGFLYRLKTCRGITTNDREV